MQMWLKDRQFPDGALKFKAWISLFSVGSFEHLLWTSFWAITMQNSPPYNTTHERSLIFSVSLFSAMLHPGDVCRNTEPSECTVYTTHLGSQNHRLKNVWKGSKSLLQCEKFSEYRWYRVEVICKYTVSHSSVNLAQVQSFKQSVLGWFHFYSS